MSVAMLSSVNASFYQMAGALPVSATSAISTPRVAAVKPVEHDHDHRPRFRESTLVNAMMAAFQALGVGQPAASSATGTTAPAVPTSAAAPVTSTPTTSTVATPSTPAVDTTPSTTATTATEAAPSADTLEKAVNEFAHALFSMLHRQERGGHSDGDHGGEHAHSHEGRRSHGYNGFVQRLEQLAQSLGTAPAAAASTSPSASTTATTPVVTQTTEAPATPATPSTVPGTDTASPAPSRGVTRLLAAFSKVLSLLQPPATSTGTTPPADTTTPPATGTATSTADKLKLFLTTLAQSLHSGAATAPPSAVGSRVDATV